MRAVCSLTPMKQTLSLVLVVLLAIGLTAQTTASPDVLLKAAMQKEQIDNDLPGAIAAYKSLVEKFPKDSASASALLQLAGIYTRQGNAVSAREAHEQILRDHPSSTAAIRARELLTRATGPGVKENEIAVTGKASGMLGEGRVSPDGRYISFADTLVVSAGGTGNLALFDTTTGATTIVNKFSNQQEPWGEGNVEFTSIWSPDGRELAYCWRPEGGVFREVRIVNRQSGQHRTIFRSPEGVTWLAPMAYSPDGQQVVAALAQQAGEGTVKSAELALISVRDGKKQTLRSLDWSFPGNAVFSRDGKWVAYDHQPVVESPSRDVRLISVDGKRDVPVADDRTSHEVLLGWLPDGQLLIASDRSGQTDAMTIKVNPDGTLGAPVTIKRGVGQLTPQGVTADGRVFVQRTANIREVYVAEIDPETGKMVKPPAPLARAQPSVNRSEPAFSPDGTRIAYVQSAPGVAQSIVIQTLDTNDVRTYAVAVRNIDWPLWNPDGRSFLFDGTGTDGVQRTFRLDLASGKVEAAFNDILFGLSPDGRWAYTRGGEFGGGLVRRNLQDGRTEQISQPPDSAQGSTLSPDGRWVAFIVRGGGADVGAGASAGLRGNAAVHIRPTDGGPSRAIAENLRVGYARLAWSHDSRFVIFGDNPGGLSRVDIHTGVRQALGFGGPAGGFGVVNERTMNADGRRLAFGTSRNRRELVVWENVMPKGRRP